MTRSQMAVQQELDIERETPETWVRCPNCGVDFVGREYAFDPEDDKMRKCKKCGCYESDHIVTEKGILCPVMFEPIEKKVEMDWSTLPAWANWVAMDWDEKWYWFVNEPTKFIDSFSNQDTDKKDREKYGQIPEEHAPAPVDWEKSLTRVPMEGE